MISCASEGHIPTGSRFPLCRIAVAAVLFAAVMLCASGGGNATRPTGLAGSGTLAYSRPKIDISSLTWALPCSDGGHYVLLHNEQEMLARALLEEIRPGWRSATGPIVLSGETLTAVAPLLPEKRGSDYRVLLPNRCAWREQILSDFKVEADGITVPHIEGILTSPGGAPLQESSPGGRYALALPCSATMFMRPMAPESPPPDSERLLAAIREVGDVEPSGVTGVVGVYLQYPKVAAWCVVGRITERLQLMYCFKGTDGPALEWVPFECTAAEVRNNGLVYELTDSGSDFDMKNPRMDVLPDLNGNGSSELLVQSASQAFLFDGVLGGKFERTPVFRETLAYVCAP